MTAIFTAHPRFPRYTLRVLILSHGKAAAQVFFLRPCIFAAAPLAPRPQAVLPLRFGGVVCPPPS